MKTETKKIRKWFWVWNDEKEEAWLRNLSSGGWHLQKIGFLATYEFEHGVSRDIIYRIDYKDGYNLKLSEYLQIFRDSGWEHVGEMSGRHYFRTPMAGEEEPEIYTDNESKIIKYQRILTGYYIFIPLFLLVIINRPEITKIPGFSIFDIILIGLLLMELFFLYVVLNLIKRIRQLKRI